jgi:hypothetical protein
MRLPYTERNSLREPVEHPFPASQPFPHLAIEKRVYAEGETKQGRDDQIIESPPQKVHDYSPVYGFTGLLVSGLQAYRLIGPIGKSFVLSTMGRFGILKLM